MPPSYGYRDVTAIYTHVRNILTYIYDKYQYRQESECESTEVIDILTEKYIVITESDIILQK